MDMIAGRCKRYGNLCGRQSFSFSSLDFGFFRALGRRDDRLSVNDYISILIDACCFELDAVGIEVNREDFHLSRNRVTNVYRRCEVQGLMDIDSAGAGEFVRHNSRQQACRKDAVGNAGFEKGFFGIGLIDVSRIEVAGDTRKQIDIAFRNGFAESGAFTDLQVVYCFLDHWDLS